MSIRQDRSVDMYAKASRKGAGAGAEADGAGTVMGSQDPSQSPGGRKPKNKKEASYYDEQAAAYEQQLIGIVDDTLAPPALQTDPPSAWGQQGASAQDHSPEPAMAPAWSFQDISGMPQEDMAQNGGVDNLCVLCYTNTADKRLYPCLHIACHQCVTHMRKQTVFKPDKGTRCPFCRTNVQSYLEIWETEPAVATKTDAPAQNGLTSNAVSNSSFNAAAQATATARQQSGPDVNYKPGLGINNPRPAGAEKNKEPWMYKTKLCNRWEATGHCSFGDDCWFAHVGVEELRKPGLRPGQQPREGGDSGADSPLGTGPPSPQLPPTALPAQHCPPPARELPAAAARPASANGPPQGRREERGGAGQRRPEGRGQARPGPPSTKGALAGRSAPPGGNGATSSFWMPTPTPDSLPRNCWDHGGGAQPPAEVAEAPQGKMWQGNLGHGPNMPLAAAGRGRGLPPGSNMWTLSQQQQQPNFPPGSGGPVSVGQQPPPQQQQPQHFNFQGQQMPGNIWNQSQMAAAGGGPRMMWEGQGSPPPQMGGMPPPQPQANFGFSMTCAPGTGGPMPPMPPQVMPPVCNGSSSQPFMWQPGGPCPGPGPDGAEGDKVTPDAEGGGTGGAPSRIHAKGGGPAGGGMGNFMPMKPFGFQPAHGPKHSMFPPVEAGMPPADMLNGGPGPPLEAGIPPWMNGVRQPPQQQQPYGRKPGGMPGNGPPPGAYRGGGGLGGGYQGGPVAGMAMGHHEMLGGGPEEAAHFGGFPPELPQGVVGGMAQMWGPGGKGTDLSDNLARDAFASLTINGDGGYGPMGPGVAANGGPSEMQIPMGASLPDHLARDAFASMLPSMGGLPPMGGPGPGGEDYPLQQVPPQSTPEDLNMDFRYLQELSIE